MYESVWWCDPDAPAPGDVSRVDGIDESSLSVPSFDRSPPRCAPYAAIYETVVGLAVYGTRSTLRAFLPTLT